MADEDDPASSQSDEEDESGVGKVKRLPAERVLLPTLEKGKGFEGKVKAVSKERSGESSESESDSDYAEKFNTVARAKSITGQGQKHMVPPSPNPTTKRSRDVPEDVPVSKKKKEAKADRVKPASGKPVFPVSPSMSEKASNVEGLGKPSKSQLSKAEKKLSNVQKLVKEKVENDKVEKEKSQGETRKRKSSHSIPSTPIVNGTVKEVIFKVEAEKGSPVKPKKVAQWTGDLEIALTSQLLQEVKRGAAIPQSRLDPYWDKLTREIPGFGGEWNGSQLSEKVRRMKNKYNTLVEKTGNGGKPYKNATDEELFKLWKQIWDRSDETGEATPVKVYNQSVVNKVEERSEMQAKTKEKPLAASTGDPVQIQDFLSSDDDDTEVPTGVGKSLVALHEAPAVPASVEAKEVGVEASAAFPISPFAPKPLLEHTPVIPKDVQKRKGSRLSEDPDITREGEVVEAGSVKLDAIDTMKAEISKTVQLEISKSLQDYQSTLHRLIDDAFRGRSHGFSASSSGGCLDGLVLHPSNGVPVQLLQPANEDAALIKLQEKWNDHKTEELGLLAETYKVLQERAVLRRHEVFRSQPGGIVPPLNNKK